jgi:RNA-directed DNA polymerase
MLERAKAVTRYQRWTAVEYARFADDLVILVDSHPRQQWLRGAVEQRLREELAKLQGGGERRKEPKGGPQERGSFGFLGFEFRRIRSHGGRWMPLHAQDDFPKLSLSARQSIDRTDQSHSARLGQLLCIGHSSRCHLTRTRQRQGFGWKRWSREWLYETLGLSYDYRVSHPQSSPAAAPS